MLLDHWNLKFAERSLVSFVRCRRCFEQWNHAHNKTARICCFTYKTCYAERLEFA